MRNLATISNFSHMNKGMFFENADQRLGNARSYIYISDPVGSLTLILLSTPYSDVTVPVLVQYTAATSNSFFVSPTASILVTAPTVPAWVQIKYIHVHV
jgi:hypothetical protein